jgi:tetratricopeptide (TPR) repeat protein
MDFFRRPMWLRVVGLALLCFLLPTAVPRSQTRDRASQYYQSGLARKAKGDLDGAIADYSKAIEINPRYAEAFVNRGVARKAKGDLSGAIADYDKALALDPGLKEAYNNRGLARQLQGSLDPAIADFDKAIELDAHYAGAHYNRASAARAKGDLKLAIAELTKAIESPDNDHLSETYDNRGTIRHEMGDNVGAVADFTKAIEINPRNVFAYSNRGYALILLDKDTEAQKDFDRILKMRPGFQREVDATIKKAKEERAAKKGP